MSNLRASLADLSAYSQFLSSMQTSVDASKANLVSTIESIKGSWKGTDADTFVTNATAYLENLGVISGLLGEYAGITGAKAKKYATGIEDFYAAIG